MEVIVSGKSMAELLRITLPPSMTWQELFDTEFVRVYETNKFMNMWNADSTHRAFFEAIKSLPDSNCMPYDVRVNCSDGFVLMHKFLLMLHSDFFRAALTYKTGLPDASEVDLTNFTRESFEIVSQWMYKGRFGNIAEFCQNFGELFLLGNYINVPFVVEAAQIVFKALVGQGIIGDQEIMTVYFLSSRLNEVKMQEIAAGFFCFMKELPADFAAVDYKHFHSFIRRLDYLCHLVDTDKGDRCPRTMLRSVTSCAGLTALPRERYILNLIAEFIRYDKPQRLQYATELFKLLKLAYIAKEIDFVQLGLEELGNRHRFGELHELIQLCTVRDDFDFYSSSHNIPMNYWVPRPTSIRYSIWSKKRLGSYDLNFKNPKIVQKKRPLNSQGNLPSKRHSSGQPIDINNNNNEDTTDKDQIKKRLFRFERSQDCRIIQVDVFPKMISKSWIKGIEIVPGTIVAGIRFHWSDGTVDSAGHIDENNKEVARFDPHQGFSINYSLTKNTEHFLDSIAFLTCLPFHEMHLKDRVPKGAEYKQEYLGPFGSKRLVEDQLQVGRNDTTFKIPHTVNLLGQSVSNHPYTYLMYVDGLKGWELSNGQEKLISGLHFKLSIHSNNSLAHLCKQLRTKKTNNANDETDSNVRRVDVNAQAGNAMADNVNAMADNANAPWHGK